VKKCKNDRFDIFISTIGNKNCQRYQVKNCNGMFWNEKKWVKNAKDATLYYWHEDAAKMIKQIEHDLNKDKHVARYQIPVICEVIGDTPLEISQLIDYLYKGTKLSLTLPNPEGLVVQVQMKISEMSEIKPEIK